MEAYIITLTLIGVIVTLIGVIIAWMQYRVQKEKHLYKEYHSNTDSFDPIHLISDEKALEQQQTPPLMIKASELNDVQLDTLSMLVEASALLLERDFLTGSWGRTLIKYIDITQYGSMWTDEAKYKYLLSGSITNTFHALNGLSHYYDIAGKSMDLQMLRHIFAYINTWRMRYGVFSTPVTNFDASIGAPDFAYGNQQEIYYNQDPQLLRHTACGILTIDRLLTIRNQLRELKIKDDQIVHYWESILGYLNEYIVAALKAISSYADFIKIKGSSIWGKLKFTPAYVILAIDVGLRLKSGELNNDDIYKLKEIKTTLINFILEEGLQPGERFLFQNINKKAYYYFSLIVLEYFLHISEFITDRRSHNFSSKIMSGFYDVILKTRGLSFGNPNYPDQRWLNYLDVGITSRFLYVSALYKKAFNISNDSKAESAFNMAFQFIASNAFDHEIANFNSLTQGWESIIQLSALCDNETKQIIRSKIINHEFINGELLEKFIHRISQKDFAGYNQYDVQKRFIELLVKFPGFREYYSLEANQHVDNMTFDASKLQICLKNIFTQEDFLSFLESNRIPFRNDASLENLINTTLMQFQFL